MRNKFLNPATDGAVLPILHLNGYKIANPTMLARIPHEELEALLGGYGYAPIFVEGDEPEPMHQLMATALDAAFAEIRAIQQKARKGGKTERPIWPMIVLKSPKGWTGPKKVDGKKTEGYWRSHQVPFTKWQKPGHVRLLEDWMKSYKPDELFDADRRAEARNRRAGPIRRQADERQSARQWRAADAPARLPDFAQYAVEVTAAGRRGRRVDEDQRRLPARCDEAECSHPQFPGLRPRRDRVEPAPGSLRGHRSGLECRDLPL